MRGGAHIRRLTLSAGALGAGVALLAGGPAAAPDRVPPRIAAAAMQDVNGNGRADRLLLTYSEPIRHRADRDGRYPLAVAGYRIRTIGAASGRTLVVLLVERTQPDASARPAIRYARTKAQPVTDRAGNQAVNQTFRAVRAHRVPAPGPAPPPSASDRDRDGWDDARDCAPDDPAIHPGAGDLPDLAFVDSNCDGIDGTEANAIFASPLGNDANPGTKTAPKRQLGPAVLAASLAGKHVYAAAGAYARVVGETGIGIYGGYDPNNWSRRSADRATIIVGSPEAFLADDERGIVLQLLTLQATQATVAAYGIRAVNGSALRLERVTVTAASGRAGAAGSAGARGAPGISGRNGAPGECDSIEIGLGRGGEGGASTIGRNGGNGGSGGRTYFETRHGGSGGPSADGTPGGAGGRTDNPGRPGQNGRDGAHGGNGLAGGIAFRVVGATWRAEPGTSGTNGAHGRGGGGGGGGGGQTGVFVINGTGNGGGGGGSGGGGGGAGQGGGAGDSSFGVYLWNSRVEIVGSTITAGDGGTGGRGGDGAQGGTGGLGGLGGRRCVNELGAGGNGGGGGNGGAGGGGGGGGGGWSVGILKIGSSEATVVDSRVVFGAAGLGGAPGQGGNASRGRDGTANAVVSYS